jgi:hypothetical protein
MSAGIMPAILNASRMLALICKATAGVPLCQENAGAPECHTQILIRIEACTPIRYYAQTGIDGSFLEASHTAVVREANEASGVGTISVKVRRRQGRLRHE